MITDSTQQTLLTAENTGQATAETNLQNTEINKTSHMQYIVSANNTEPLCKL